MITKFHYFMLLVMIISLQGCSESNEFICVDSNCADYLSQIEAQAAYLADPECRNDLDADNDGIACEQYSGYAHTSNTGCPTTANCGCSNRNKDACADACCKWVVGTGCVCK